jgi:hypothetical protein
MYDIALSLHSWLRWAVLLLGLLAIARAVAGRSSGRWTAADNRVGAAFAGALDLQMLVGLILYFALSPITRETMRDMGAAMANSSLRFWAVEHPFGMLAGLVLAHIGRARIRKTTDAARKHRIALIFFTLALLIILATIPWPGRPYGRALFRM